MDLAQLFEMHRPRLRAVAARVLGSAADADDAVQETWVRLARTGDDGVDDLGAWLTTVVSRVALTMLRARATRPEAAPEDDAASRGALVPDGRDEAPDARVELDDAVGTALLVLLDTLTPTERLAFVLHDLFGMPFDEIAPIVERTPVATRQLASRARRRVRGAAGPPDDPGRRRRVVDAFLAAAREGDFAGLLTVLDPDVVLRADPAAVAAATANRHFGAPPLSAQLCGADAVARVFSGRAAAAVPALVDGEPGAVFAPGGRPYSVFRFVIVADRIAAMELVADPERIGGFDLQ